MEVKSNRPHPHFNFIQQEISANLFVFQYFVVSLRPKLDKQYNV